MPQKPSIVPRPEAVQVCVRSASPLPPIMEPNNQGAVSGSLYSFDSLMEETHLLELSGDALRFVCTAYQ